MPLGLKFSKKERIVIRTPKGDVIIRGYFRNASNRNLWHRAGCRMKIMLDAPFGIVITREKENPSEVPATLNSKR